MICCEGLHAQRAIPRLELVFAATRTPHLASTLSLEPDTRSMAALILVAGPGWETWDGVEEATEEISDPLSFHSSRWRRI